MPGRSPGLELAKVSHQQVLRTMDALIEHQGLVDR
jgi:hypothetical protein